MNPATITSAPDAVRRRRGRVPLGLVGATFGFAILTWLAATGCKSASGSASGGGSLPLPGGGSVDFEGHIRLGDSTYEADNSSSKCFEIKFYDANGQEVGGATISPGSNHGGMPSTATSWTAVEKPCPPSGATGGGTGGGTSAEDEETIRSLDVFALDVRRIQAGALGGPAIGLFAYDVVGGPVWFDRASLNHNALYSLRILAGSPDEAAIRARQTIAAPLGTAPDQRVEVLMLSQVQESGTSASFLTFAPAPIATFDLSVNEFTDYAVLGNGAVQSYLTTGMWCVESPISLTDLQAYGATNQMHVDFEHAGSSGPRYTSYAIRHFD